jgi:hypothetical protein
MNHQCFLSFVYWWRDGSSFLGVKFRFSTGENWKAKETPVVPNPGLHNENHIRYIVTTLIWRDSDPPTQCSPGSPLGIVSLYGERSPFLVQEKDSYIV